MLYFITCSFMFLWLIGIILSVARWKQSPRTAILTILGLAGMIAAGVIELVQNYLFVTSPGDLNLSPALYGNLLRVFLYGRQIFEFIGWILVLFAIFSSVKKATPSES